MDAEIRKVLNNLDFSVPLKEGGLNFSASEGAKVSRRITSSEDRLTSYYKTPYIKRGETLNVNVAAMIDHTLLKPTAQKNDILRLCEEAKMYRFASVCVNPYWVKLCSEVLSGTGIDVCTVVGFPLGATTTYAKTKETEEAIKNGATEIDMVINIGALKDKDYKAVQHDIEEVVKAASGNVVKVIIECCYLTDEEKITACIISKAAGAHFVKTSTGFGSWGARAEDVLLMRKTVGEEMGVKAAGGIRSYEDAVKMIKSGANRLGTSSGVKIAKEEAELKRS